MSHNNDNTDSLTLLDQPMSNAAHTRKAELFPDLQRALTHGVRKRKAIQTALAVIPVILLSAVTVALWPNTQKSVPAGDNRTAANNNSSLAETNTAQQRAPYRVIHTSSDINEHVKILSDDELLATLEQIGQPAGLIRKDGVTFLSTEFTSTGQNDAEQQHNGT
ncbi:MAG: hypothetical protein H6815_06975 [Phycisphaeraceae bacterium]|nr:hypothetical protein [Phycisphaerales bacterium]MCB9860182.1 hypothetical protein [Phycisphaeraceae bacterium]